MFDNTIIEIFKDNAISVCALLLYVVLGGAMMIFNGLILAAVVRHSGLRSRKEYVMLAGMALSDVLNGMAYLTAGIYRLFLTFTKGIIIVSAWDRLQNVHSVFFVLCHSLNGAMFFCVNLDRLIAVTLPIRYRALGVRYALLLNACFYGPGLLMSCYSVYLSYIAPVIRKYPSICLFIHVIDQDDFYSVFFPMYGFVLGSASIILFAIVWVIASLSMRKVQVTAIKGDQSFAKRQRRMTTTIGISCLCTLFLYVIPTMIKMLVDDQLVGQARFLGIQLLGAFNNLNAILNYFIYTSRHKDIREGIKWLFSGKSLTEQRMNAMLKSKTGVSKATTQKL